MGYSPNVSSIQEKSLDAQSPHLCFSSFLFQWIPCQSVCVTHSLSISLKYSHLWDLFIVSHLKCPFFSSSPIKATHMLPPQHSSTCLDCSRFLLFWTPTAPVIGITISYLYFVCVVISILLCTFLKVRNVSSHLSLWAPECRVVHRFLYELELICYLINEPSSMSLAFFQ